MKIFRILNSLFDNFRYIKAARKLQKLFISYRLYVGCRNYQSNNDTLTLKALQGKTCILIEASEMILVKVLLVSFKNGGEFIQLKLESTPSPGFAAQEELMLTIGGRYDVLNFQLDHISAPQIGWLLLTQANQIDTLKTYAKDNPYPALVRYYMTNYSAFGLID